MKQFFLNVKCIIYLSLFCLCISSLNAQSTDLVIIDGNYSLKQDVINNLPNETAVIELSENQNPWKQIREYLIQNQSINAMHLFVNTNVNSLEMGGISYTSSVIDQEFELSMLEGLYTGTHFQLLIYNCTIGATQSGIDLLNKMSEKSYFNIAVPTNCTSVFNTSNLVFDYKTMELPINSSILQ